MNIDKKYLYTYLESKIGISVNDNTRFFDQIGIDGLDAFTFIDEFAKEFKVDMTTYEWDKYHANDADVTNFFKALCLAIFRRKKQHKKFFTAKHLYDVVQKGKWFDMGNVG